MKKIMLMLSLLFISVLFSQEKLFNVDDLVLNSRQLRPETINSIQWISESKNVSYVASDGKSLLSKDLKNNISTLVTLEELSFLLKKLNFNVLTFFPRIKWINSESFIFSYSNAYFSYNIKSKKLEIINQYDKIASNISPSPNNQFIAYTIDNNLFVKTDKTEPIQITKDTDKNIVNGQAVHRSEFGITNGIFWSPLNNNIAYYKMDESMVIDYPIVDWNNIPAVTKYIKYPMAGTKSHHVKIGVYNIVTQKEVFLNTGKPLEQYLTCVTWSPDEKYIFVAQVQRNQKEMALVKYDANTGEKIKVLFEEKHNKYVEPENNLIFLPNENNKFLWFSERDGYKHLYLYDTEGNLIKQVTSGNWVITDFLGFDEKNDFFIVTTKETPIERHLYKANIKNTNLTKITTTSGNHRIQINFKENLFIDSFSNFSTPNVTQIINDKGKVISNLLESTNPLKDYNLPERKIITLKTENDIDLYCRLVLPLNFDPNKKYPVIFYVYGGPHSQYALNQWPVGLYDLWEIMMAQKGYVVFYMDNRGTSNRGLEFEQATHGQLGTKEIEDQLVGVNYLLSQGYVDKDRFGVWGWSYGGFMTTSLMTRTDAFKVGVAGGAVIDWNMYEIMYGERYMDSPLTNKEGYNKANLLNYVEKLKGKKLLLVHGTSDDVVVWQHSILFAKKAANLNIPLDYYPYINHGHGVSGKDALHLYNYITNYFLNNL